MCKLTAVKQYSIVPHSHIVYHLPLTFIFKRAVAVMVRIHKPVEAFSLLDRFNYQWSEKAEKDLKQFRFRKRILAAIFSPWSCWEECRWRLIPRLLFCWAIEKKIGKAKTQSRENTGEVERCSETCSFSSERRTNDNFWRKLLMHKKEIDEVPEVQAEK